jgi:hypothetical protein
VKVHNCADDWGAIPLLSIRLRIEEKLRAFDFVQIDLVSDLYGLLLEIYVEIVVYAINVYLSYPLLACKITM